MLKPLKLEEFLSEEEQERFHAEWERVKGILQIAEPYEVHSAMPVISKPWQFKDNVFRARVLQRRLRRFNPYFNSQKYMVLFWHPQHYGLVAEQMYHACHKISQQNYHRNVIKDIPQIKIKRLTFWSNSNKHLSVIGLAKMRRGSWENGNAIEQSRYIVYSDKECEECGSVGSPCFIGLRSYVKAFHALQRGESDALKRIQNLIQDQASQHKRLTTQRTDLREDEAGEIIQKCRDGRITLEQLDHFFSLYDLPTS